MNFRKFNAVPALPLLLVLLLAGVASAASILNSYNQIGQVVGSTATSGSFTIASMKSVSGDGNLQSISSLPANQVFVLTKVTMSFQGDSTWTDSVTFNVGGYYRLGFTLNGGFCAGSDSISPGVPIADLGALLYLYKNADASKTPLAGKLNVRLMGYIANLN